jgi:hypothetical protein
MGKSERTTEEGKEGGKSDKYSDAALLIRREE